MYRKRKQGRLNRKVAHTGISLLHFPSALPEPALPPLLRTTLRAGGDTLSHLISFLYHRWCAVRPGASEAPRLRAETHSGVQARPYGRGLLRSRVILERLSERVGSAFSCVCWMKVVNEAKNGSKRYTSLSKFFSVAAKERVKSLVPAGILTCLYLYGSCTPPASKVLKSTDCPFHCTCLCSAFLSS